MEAPLPGVKGPSGSSSKYRSRWRWRGTALFAAGARQPALQQVPHPDGIGARQRGGHRASIVDPFVVAAERIDAVNQRLKVEGEVGRRLHQWHRDLREGALKMSRPDIAGGRPGLTADQERVRAFG